MFLSCLVAACLVYVYLLNLVSGQQYETVDPNKSFYYFGNENVKKNGRDLADAYGDGSCQVNHFQCLNNPNNLISAFSALTPYDCCKSCLNDTKCVAYNHLYLNATNHTEYITNDSPQCQLFSTFPNDTKHVYQGNCVMGTSYDDKTNGKRPNYVFFFPDTIRMESMSLYQYPLDSTPNLKAFAQHATTFNNHIAQHSQCAPSRNSMITGRYMHVLGHRTQQHLVQYWEANYFRWLKDSGYYILWLGKNDALSVASFPLSVNEWKGLNGVKHGSNPYTYPEAGYFSFLYTGSNIYGNSTANGDYKAVVTAKQFLMSDPPQPFFIFLPGTGAHPPYGAPLDYHNKFNASQIKEKAPLRAPNVADKAKYHSNHIGIQYWRNLTGFDADFFYKINSVYIGMVNYVDWIFGQLVAAVDEYDTLTDTTSGLIMSSDHGDFGGDYHLVEKWPGGADDVLLRIPLLMRMPNGVHGGVSINMSTANFDILATMLDLANVEIEFNSFARSLKEQVIGGKEGDLHRFVYSEGGFSANNEVFPGGSDHITNEENLYWPRAEEEMTDNGNGSPRWAMLRNAYCKLVFRPLGISELYDLEKDPRQLTNLWNSNDEKYRNIKIELMTNLTTWFVLTSDVTPILMDPRGVPKQEPNYSKFNNSF